MMPVSFEGFRFKEFRGNFELVKSKNCYNNFPFYNNFARHKSKYAKNLNILINSGVNLRIDIIM